MYDIIGYYYYRPDSPLSPLFTHQNVLIIVYILGNQ